MSCAPPTAEPTLASLLGIPTEIEFEGKAYRLRQANLDELAMFGVWLQRRALEACARAVDLPDDAQDRLYRSTMRDIAAGAYDAFSEAGAAAMATPSGQAYLLHLVLRTAHPEVTPEFAARMLQKKAAEVLAAMGAEEVAPGDPKAADLKAAICVGLGLPSDFLSSGSGSPRSTSPGTRSADSPPAS